MAWYDHSSYAFKKKLSKEERYFKISWKYQSTSPMGCSATIPAVKNDDNAEPRTLFNPELNITTQMFYL